MTDPDMMDRLQLASLDADEARSWCRPGKPPGPTEQERRIEQLEAELARLRAELEAKK